MRRASRARARLAACTVAVALVAALVPVSGVAPAAFAASGYPSWNDVQAAKASQAATQAEVVKINGLLAGLQTAANAASLEAITRAAESAAAQARLASAKRDADALAAQLSRATASASALSTRSGLLTQQLIRFGGPAPSLNLFLSEKSLPTLLYQLGAITQLTGQVAALVRAAREQRNLVHSLGAQADAARRVRDALAVTAQQQLEAATAAQQKADAELATQQENGTVLYAQLASLKNTTATVERNYAAGVAARQAAAEAARQAAENQGSGSGPADTFVPPPGVTVDPTAAQNYARGAIGSYGWGGDQMTCLVWLWNRESGWRADAYNSSSGAYGIPQSLPATKMSSAGSDWVTNANTQINWGLGYISGRYGSPCAAWAHEMAKNWY